MAIARKEMASSAQQ